MLTPEMQKQHDEHLKRLEQACADEDYQRKLHQYFSMMEEANHTYSVLNSLGMFDAEHSQKLIDYCEKWAALEADIRTKRNYYEGSLFLESPPLKMLAIIYEKNSRYSASALVCVRAIKNGYPNDGTKGGMRGRLARMIKKGKLDVTDEMKQILGI